MAQQRKQPKRSLMEKRHAKREKRAERASTERKRDRMQRA